jgi:predicted NUDIX family NTP pyrophosphohydrolase
VDSAGLLLYRRRGGRLDVLLGHMGGPYWARRDDRAWSVPKGLVEAGEVDLVEVAEREFAEEMGSPAPAGDSLPLGTVRSGSKTVHVFAREGEFDADAIVSNTFALEWPPRSGHIEHFPEIDRAAWFPLDEAGERLVKAQTPFLDRLVAALR